MGRLSRQKRRLSTRFLMIVAPVFVLFALPSTWLIFSYQLHTEKSVLAANIGVAAARSAAAIGRPGRGGDPGLVRDFLVPLSTDQAFLCAEFQPKRHVVVPIVYPSQTGCTLIGVAPALRLPVGGDVPGTLLVMFSDAEINANGAAMFAATLIATLISFSAALLAAYLAFWTVVGRRLSALSQASDRRADQGEWRVVVSGPKDELGSVITSVNEMMLRDDARNQALEEARSAVERDRAALAELNATLEARVLERTDQLEAALSVAEGANRAKSRFMWSMSHELKTPLNAIIGFSEIIGAQAFGPVGVPRYAEYAHDIAASGHRLLHSVNQILLVAKLDAGVPDSGHKTFNLLDVMEDCRRQAFAIAQNRNIDVTLSADPAGIMILGDEVHLQIAFANLIDNAIKFNRDGGRVEIDVGLSDNYAHVRITDTGIGIAADAIAGALEAFGQTDDRLARRYEGVGLGLTIAQRIVQSHNGRLTIDSDGVSGVSVDVRLPISLAAVAA